MSFFREKKLLFDMFLLEIFKNDKNIEDKMAKLYNKNKDIFDNPYFLDKCCKDGNFLYLKYIDLIKLQKISGEDFLKRAFDLDTFYDKWDDIYLYLIEKYKDNLFVFKNLKDMYFFDILLREYGEDKDFILEFSKINPLILRNKRFVEFNYLEDEKFFIDFVCTYLSNYKIDFNLLKRDIKSSLFSNKEIIKKIYEQNNRILSYIDKSLIIDDFLLENS